MIFSVSTMRLHKYHVIKPVSCKCISNTQPICLLRFVIEKKFVVEINISIVYEMGNLGASVVTHRQIERKCRDDYVSQTTIISLMTLNQSNCDSEQIRLPQNAKWKGKKSRQNMMNLRLTYFLPHLPEQFNFWKNLRPRKSISLCLFTCIASQQ